MDTNATTSTTAKRFRPSLKQYRELQGSVSSLERSVLIKDCIIRAIQKENDELHKVVRLQNVFVYGSFIAIMAICIGINVINYAL